MYTLEKLDKFSFFSFPFRSLHRNPYRFIRNSSLRKDIHTKIHKLISFNFQPKQTESKFASSFDEFSNDWIEQRRRELGEKKKNAQNSDGPRIDQATFLSGRFILRAKPPPL